MSERSRPRGHVLPGAAAFTSVVRSLLMLCAASLVLCGGAQAQTSVRGQLSFLGAFAPTATVGVDYLHQLGADAMPRPGGGPVVIDPRWSLYGAILAGATSIEIDDRAVSFTALVQAGLLHRTSWRLDRIGLVGVASARPRGAGPAVRMEAMGLFGLQAGWYWRDNLPDGALVTADFSVALIRDLLGI